MGEQTAIQWTDASQNFWTGCDKVSPGCAHCYAERLERRWGRDFTTLRRAPDARFAAPLKWKGERRVFTCSMSDFFHAGADDWRDEAWAIIRQTPHLTYQILTKRPERIASHLPPDWGATGYPNVWLGVSAEYQRQADERLPLLLRVPVAVHFVSAEPLLGPLNVHHWLGLDGIAWLIIGGESGGREARAFNPAWATSLIDQCRDYGAAPFVKQLGSVWARAHHARDWHGGDMAEWPSELRVRQFPGGQA